MKCNLDCHKHLNREDGTIGELINELIHFIAHYYVMCTGPKGLSAVSDKGPTVSGALECRRD